MADGMSWLLELNAKFDAAVGMTKALKQMGAGLKKVELAGDVDKLNSLFGRMFAGASCAALLGTPPARSWKK